jgi:hypothetical protein
MFEQEIEMEKRQSSAAPLLLMVALIIGLVGVAVYFLAESRRVLPTPEAASVVTNILAAQEPTTVRFHTGTIKEGYAEDPHDAHYLLLQKAGVITVGKAKGYRVQVALTAAGNALLKGIAGVKQSKADDGTEAYVVPLAARKLVEISSVTMSGPERATVKYTWRWEPNALGEKFDISGVNFSSFNGWDRAALIDKYGARHYHQAPTKAAIGLAKTPQGWGVATE